MFMCFSFPEKFLGSLGGADLELSHLKQTTMPTSFWEGAIPKTKDDHERFLHRMRVTISIS